MKLSFLLFNEQQSLSQQRTLFASCFPETVGTAASSLAHYHWKFHSFPAQIKSYEYAAWDEENSLLVGYYAAIPYRYNVKETSGTAGMVCDVMTHPEIRGKGIFTKLGKYSTDTLQKTEVDFVTGFPIRPEVIPGHIKVGWTIAFELPHYLKLLKTNSLLKNSPARFLAPIINIPLALINTVLGVTRRPDPTLTTQVHTATEFLSAYPEQYERFLAGWHKSAAITLKKDVNFLRWRLGAPESNYKIISVWKNERISGIAITRVVELKNIPTLAVLDLMIDSESPATVSIIHSALDELAAVTGAENISCMTSRSVAKTLCFARNGYIRTPFIFKFIVKNISKRFSDELLFDEKNWQIMWIDSDDL